MPYEVIRWWDGIHIQPSQRGKLTLRLAFRCALILANWEPDTTASSSTSQPTLTHRNTTTNDEKKA